MKLKLILYLIFFIGCVTNIYAQKERFSLEQIKTLAENNYESIQLNRLNLRQAELSKSISSAARFPKVDLSASYNHISEVGTFTIPITGLPITLPNIKFGDGNIYDASLNLSVPLFTGFRLAVMENIQDESIHLADQTLQGSIVDLRNQLSIQYKLALLAKKNIEVLDAQLNYVRESVLSRKQLFEQGQVLSFDTLQLSTRCTQILVDKSSVENQYQKLILQMMQSANLQDEFDVIEEQQFVSDLDTKNLNVLTDIAYASRYEIQSLGTSRKINELAVKSAQGAYYPSVYAMASYKYGRPGVDQIKNEWMNYYTAGLKFEWNLFSWGSDKFTIEKQAIEIQKSDLKVTQLKKQLRTQIAIILNDLEVKKKILSLLEDQIQQERLKQDLVQSRFKQGLATSNELIDAETSLTTALLKKEQTKIEYSIKLTELAATVGKEF